MMIRHFQGQRVVISGSPAFWFNIFTDTPQLYGGHDPFNPNWMTRVVQFTLQSGMNAGDRDAAICILWLKALGTHAISVPGPESGEPYQPFRRNPMIFEGRLPVVERRHGTTIYQVPQRSDSLAHVVPAGAVVDRQPIHGLDVGQVARYVSALENPSLPLASSEWTSFHSLRIRAPLEPGQVVSVQVTWQPGWQASVHGIPQTVSRDGLGMIAIEPDCRGTCTIDLEYGGATETRVARYLSLATTVMAPLLLFARRSRRTVGR